MIYKKKFNNNVAMVEDEQGKEWVVIGKGIGFNKAEGSEIDENIIERRFLAEPSKDFSYIIETIFSMKSEVIEVINEMLAQAEAFLGTTFSDDHYVQLVDHIHYALKRTDSKIDYSPSMQWETRKLYPREYQAAIHSRAFLNYKLNTNLPESELTFLTLHYVNAAKREQKEAKEEQVQRIIHSMITFICDELNITFDKETPESARFLTHLRYFVIRQIEQEPLAHQELDEDFEELVKEKYQHAYQVALGLSERIRRVYGWEITDNELLFLTIHIWHLYKRSQS